MVGKTLEAAPDQLVVVAAERVPGDVAELRTSQHALGVGAATAVVHAHADDPYGARHQGRGTGAAHAVAGHVPELSVIAGIEPCEQRRLVGAQIAAGDRHLLKAELHRGGGRTDAVNAVQSTSRRRYRSGTEAVSCGDAKICASHSEIWLF